MSGFKPDGWSTVTPRIVTEDVATMVAFLKAVFSAEGEVAAGRPAELRIGDSTLMVSDGGGLRQPGGAFLYVYVPDVDAAFARACDLGAESLEPPAPTPYGDRRAMFRDPWGGLWQIATRTGAS